MLPSIDGATWLVDFVQLSFVNPWCNPCVLIRISMGTIPVVRRGSSQWGWTQQRHLHQRTKSVAVAKDAVWGKLDARLLWFSNISFLCLSFCLLVCASVFACLSVCLFACLFVFLLACCLCAYVFACLSTRMCTYVSFTSSIFICCCVPVRMSPCLNKFLIWKDKHEDRQAER